jgi:hypothetical protein
VLKHELEPHEAAIPFALTGTRLGRPLFSGLGAAVNDRYAPGVDEPFRAVVLDCGSPQAARFAAESNTTFGREKRPLLVRMDDPNILDMLLRGDDADPATFDHTDSDDLKKILRDRYADGLDHGSGVTVRSKGFESYDAAFDQLVDQHHAVRALLAGTAFETAPSSPAWDDNLTRSAIQLAVQLLRDKGVHYVCVIDAGVFADYDTHDDDSDPEPGPKDHQAGNQFNVCDQLAELSGELQAMGALVALTTEFGRKPVNGEPTGTEHWPHGYVNVLMGGTIPTSGTRGAMTEDEIGTEGAMERGPYNPTDIRLALATHLDVAVEDLLDLRNLSNISDAEREAGIDATTLETRRNRIVNQLLE